MDTGRRVIDEEEDHYLGDSRLMGVLIGMVFLFSILAAVLFVAWLGSKTGAWS